jgi:peroxin-5
MGYGVDARLHQQVSRMFLEATKLDPNDADLWTVLGVLYHITSDFDLAADAFRAAVRLRPDNAELWNKLGATLANADNNTEALGPYRRALQLRPGFVRAQSNLGICFYNQGQHDKAIPVFLDLLEGSPENKHVWSLLRMSLTLSGRSDAAQVSRSLDVSEVRRALEHDV